MIICFCSLIDPHMITHFFLSFPYFRCKASRCEGRNLKEGIRKLEIRRLEREMDSRTSGQEVLKGIQENGKDKKTHMH